MSSHGSSRLPDAILNTSPVGWLKWPGGSHYTIHYARSVPRLDGGQDLILITDGMWTWWRSDSASSGKDPFTVIQVRLNSQGVGEGKLSLGAAIAANKELGVMLTDYGSQPVLLSDVRREKDAQTTTS